jgi:hypothetical protein
MLKPCNYGQQRMAAEALLEGHGKVLKIEGFQTGEVENQGCWLR